MRTLDVLCQPLLLATVCGALGVACGEPVDDDEMTALTGTTPTVPAPVAPTTEPTPTTPPPGSPTTEPTPTMPVPAAPTTEPEPSTTNPPPSMMEPEPSTMVPAASTTQPAPTMPVPVSPTEPEPSMPEPVDTPGDVVAMTFAEVREFLDTDTGTIAPCFFCHSEGGDLPQVFRNDDTLYDTLVTRTISRCDDRALVVPGDPDSSALYLVLSGSCGTVSQMPYGCYEAEDGSENSCTSYEDRERLRLWIEAGAPQ